MTRPPQAARPRRPAAPPALGRLPRRAACRINRRMVYEVESGRAPPPGALDRHRRECLACQAAAVYQRKLLKDLRSLRSRVEQTPYDMSAVFYHPVAVSREEQPGGGPFAVHPGVRAAVASAASLAALGAVVAAGRWMRSHAG